MRIERLINGIYSTIHSGGEVYFVPRFYPYIMRIQLNNLTCDESFRIEYKIGNAGVILLDDEKFFYCITRSPISVIRISKEDGKNVLFKYDRRSSVCNNAFLHGKDIIILTSESNRDGEMIIVKNKDNKIEFVDKNIDSENIDSENIDLLNDRSIPLNISNHKNFQFRQKRILNCEGNYVLISDNTIDVVTPGSKIQTVYKFSEEEQSICGSLYLCATTNNSITFLWPWKAKHMLSINWNNLDVEQMDIIFDCEWQNNIVTEDKDLSLNDFLSVIINGRN